MRNEIWFQDSWYDKSVNENGWICTGTLLRRQWIKKASFVQLQSGEGELSDWSGDIVYLRRIQVRSFDKADKQLKLF